jgi:N-acetylglutamate synthase-like GNAT family acetyltransferase
MSECDYELRRPQTQEEWREFHSIRRKVLFENRGKGDSYLDNHPDDFKSGNHPLILIHKGHVIGVCRLDEAETELWLRRVAIREELQRLGHGRVFLRLVEHFAVQLGGKGIRTNAAIEAIGFYERCNYCRDSGRDSPPNSVSMVKFLY